MGVRTKRKSKPPVGVAGAVSEMSRIVLLWGRRCLRLSQAELYSRIGLAHGLLHDWINGVCYPREETLIVIVAFIRDSLVRIEFKESNVAAAQAAVNKARKALRDAQDRSPMIGRISNNKAVVCAYCDLISAMIRLDESRRRACGAMWL